jgi:hypothetical protein
MSSSSNVTAIMSSNVTVSATVTDEACRVAHLAEWVLTANSTLESVVPIGTLQSIQQTNELFAVAESYCQGHIKAYNAAAGRTCILQQDASPDGVGMSNLTYTEFWEGVGNMDGSYSLAAMFSRTENFTLAPTLNMCNNDCYVSEGGEGGCLFGQIFLPFIGDLSQSHVCYNEWSEMDAAWNELRVCAATAVYNNNDHYDDAQNLEERNTVERFQVQRDKSLSCAIKACNRLASSESTRLTPPGGRVVIIASSLMMVFLMIL